MFGRRRARRVATQTIDDTHGLVSAVLRDIEGSVWFEDGEFLRGKKAVTKFISRVGLTDNVIFLTLNSLSPRIRELTETITPDILQALVYPPDAIGLNRPAYYAKNCLLEKMFDVDVANVAEIDLSAADQAISWGLMGYAEDQLTRGVNERAMQSVVVAVTLAAGWLESPERAGL
jgi:hypothetical protein